MRAPRLFTAVCLVWSLAGVLTAVSGCGGASGDSSAGRGSASLKVRWPSTRDMPPATRSLRVLATTLVENSDGEKIEDARVGEQVAIRPEGQVTSTVVLENLPSVEIRIKVLAYSSTNGSGTPIALGVKDVTIAAGQNTPVEIVLHADIASLVATPGSLALVAGQTGALTISATELGGSPVVIDGNRLSFTSLSTNIATVAQRTDPNGHVADVRAFAAGETTIRVTDTVTGLTLDVPVTESAGTGLSSYFVRLGSQTWGPSPEEQSEGVYIENETGVVGTGYATIYNVKLAMSTGFTGEAQTIAKFLVNAPEAVGPFTANVTFYATIEQTANAKLAWPGGSDVQDQLTPDGPVQRTHAFSVSHGDTIEIRLEGAAGSAAQGGFVLAGFTLGSTGNVSATFQYLGV